MATKTELTNQIKDLTAKIKANSKDAHFAETLIEQLLLAKGQLVAEPIELNVGTKISSFKGGTFEMVKTTRGVLYHEYGGYNIFVTPQNTSLYETLIDYIDSKAKYTKLEGEEKEIFEVNSTAMAYCLSVPKFCFSDAEFTYKIAKDVVEYLTTMYDKLMNEPLQEETITEDEEFKATMLEVENFREMIKQEKNEE